MFNNFGKILRSIREQKGYGLNQFANKIGVSPAYLSNLETGKSDTIKLQVLNQLAEEFQLLSVYSSEEKLDEFSFRVSRATSQLAHIHKSNPKLAEFLLETIEKGTELTASYNATDDFDNYHVQ
ncbi:helix-turn-helix domain-containing protein [Peribacillus acanthi]|uniref:helix-turn-helix domain-containing protein n=1 Tax=Peribacillus acanthi TaxID=2171554 RepID=UPI000D3ED0ED|nr:helix-turn-helix transcriptional regulator [Peribacillus acanthi]